MLIGISCMCLLSSEMAVRQAAKHTRPRRTCPIIGAYDGMHVIYRMIEATGGKRDPKKAVEAVKGPVAYWPSAPAQDGIRFLLMRSDLPLYGLI